MEESIENIAEIVIREFGIDDLSVDSYSPLVLAYIGDCVFEMYVRLVLISRGNMQVKKYHKDASRIVCAPAQAFMFHVIEEDLSEEEIGIYKRGRNSNPHSKAKNASRHDYMEATGFEALLGYLFLKERYERLTFLIKKSLNAFEEER